MKVRSADKEIDGVRLVTTSLPPVRSFVLSPKLIRVVGPVLAVGGRFEALGMGDMAEGLLRYTDAERVQLMLEVFAGTTARVEAETEPLTTEAALNRAFPDFTALMKALWWVIEFNFFPSGLAGLLAKAGATESPST